MVLGISTTQLEPTSINGDHLHDLMTNWQARWPSTQQPDPLATLAVITVRDLLLGLLLPLAQRQGALKGCQALQSPDQSPWQVTLHVHPCKCMPRQHFTCFSRPRACKALKMETARRSAARLIQLTDCKQVDAVQR